MLYIPLNPPELHPATHSAVAAEISTAGMPGWRPRPRTAPPRRDRTALIGLPPSRALRWLRGAGPRRRDPSTAPGAPYAAFGPAPAARRPPSYAPHYLRHPL